MMKKFILLARTLQSLIFSYLWWWANIFTATSTACCKKYF